MYSSKKKEMVITGHENLIMTVLVNETKQTKMSQMCRKSVSVGTRISHYSEFDSSELL